MKNKNNNENFGLPLKTIDIIVSTIYKNKKIKKIVLFGSRARGNYKKGSDIDIALFARSLSYDELMKIKVDIGELMLCYTIDIVDFYNLRNKNLKEHILRIRKILNPTSSELEILNLVS